MPYRVAVVLQETTDTPGRWRTIYTRAIGVAQVRRPAAEMSRVVATVAAQGSVDQLDEGRAVTDGAGNSYHVIEGVSQAGPEPVLRKSADKVSA